MKFMKWSSIVVVIALLAVWGSQAQDWNIQSVAQGPDAAKQRVLEPDVGVAPNGTAYVSYIDQKANAIKVIQLGGATAELVRDTGRVAGTSIAVTNDLVCVAWEELSDNTGVHEIWHACWKADLSALAVEPLRSSTEGVIAGQANGAGWGEFGLNFDNTFSPDGKIYYSIWTEDYSKLVAAKVVVGGGLQPCGEFPALPIPDAPNRYPTLHVDQDGGVWAAVGDVSYPPGPNIWAFYSSDQCASWKGPVDVTPTGLYSDGVGIARLGGKVFFVYDEDQGADPGHANIDTTVCDATPEGPANCVRRNVYKYGGFPNIATDGKGLYVTSLNENEVKFGYSCDGGEKWIEAHIPNKYNTGFRDPDFGAALSRFRVATSAGADKVYVVWFWRAEGKSNIMLASRPKPCQ